MQKEIPSEVRMVVEVDGNPVGVLTLDIDRLWPLINHRKNDNLPVEWMDAAKFDAVLRTAVVKRLVSRLQTPLYQALGDEMVKAELDVESFCLNAEAAAHAFGNTTSDIERVAAEGHRTAAEFYAFFWDYLLEDRELGDIKKEWKASAKK